MGAGRSPGFNLFRVPARWLAFVALGGAMLAGLGADALLKRSAVKPNRGLLIAAGLTGLLAVLAVWRAPAAAAEVDGSASPTVPTVLFWAATGLMFANVVLLSRQSARRGLLTVLLVGITAGELAIAAANMPHADLVDPAAAADPRLTAHQIEVDGGGRLLSISAGYFDTYDRAALLAYYTSIGMTERAAKAGLTAAKLKELQAPNFPLLYGLSTADGFGGGLAPTVYYSAFSALLLPEGQPRTQDGRLRELLALPECLGACVPETRWLDLMGVKYLILDKTADRFYDDVQFDVSLPVTLSGQAPTAPMPVDPPFAADELHVLLVGDPARLTVSLNGQPPIGMTAPRRARGERRPDAGALLGPADAGRTPRADRRFGRCHGARRDAGRHPFRRVRHGHARRLGQAAVERHQAVPPVRHGRAAVPRASTQCCPTHGTAARRQSTRCAIQPSTR
ncbi:MAG: hypothetical protein HND48_18960 [Chloroflexi bacterium]|nr:hypothetical protein [Chloroflexota bacterium]